jgi:hypothetical protein
MSPKDDRDTRKPLTPPAGVRAITAKPEPEIFEETTDVGGDPIHQASARAKNAANASRAAFAAIGDLRRDVRDYNRRDQEDHERIYTTLTGISDRVDAQGGRIDNVSDRIGHMEGQLGNVSGQLEVLTTVIKEDRAARNEHQKIRLVAETEIETAEAKAQIDVEAAAAKAQIDETAKYKQFRRRLVLKLAAIITPVVAALAGGITLAINRC